MEFDVTESLRISIFMSGNADGLDATSLREEVLETVLVGVEAQVSTEDGSGLTSSWRLVASRRITRKLNPDLSTVKSGLVGSIESSSGLLMRLEFNKGLALVVEEFALEQSAVRLVSLSQSIVSSVKRESLHKEFCLSVMFITNLGNFLLRGFLDSLFGWLLIFVTATVALAART